MAWFRIWVCQPGKYSYQKIPLPLPPPSCTLPNTGPSTTLLLLLVLDDVEWHAVVEEKRPNCSMDFSLIACLQVIQPLLTKAQGLPFVAAAGLHGAAARACFCCCCLLLHRNEPIFTPSLYPLQFLPFKCVLQALEGMEGLRNVSQRLHCNWQMTSEFPFKDTSTTRTHCHHQVLPFSLQPLTCWKTSSDVGDSIVGLSAIDDSPFPIQVHL